MSILTAWPEVLCVSSFSNTEFLFPSLLPLLHSMEQRHHQHPTLWWKTKLRLLKGRVVPWLTWYSSTWGICLFSHMLIFSIIYLYQNRNMDVQKHCNPKLLYYFIIDFNILLFIYFWLCWVFVAVCGLYRCESTVRILYRWPTRDALSYNNEALFTIFVRTEHWYFGTSMI